MDLVHLGQATVFRFFPTTATTWSVTGNLHRPDDWLCDRCEYHTRCFRRAFRLPVFPCVWVHCCVSPLCFFSLNALSILAQDLHDHGMMHSLGHIGAVGLVQLLRSIWLIGAPYFSTVNANIVHEVTRVCQASSCPISIILLTVYFSVGVPFAHVTPYIIPYSLSSIFG